MRMNKYKLIIEFHSMTQKGEGEYFKTDVEPEGFNVGTEGLFSCSFFVFRVNFLSKKFDTKPHLYD